MALSEYNNEQRRELIDMQQLFEAWRAADHDFRYSYRGSMHWRKINGVEYLYRLVSRTPRVEKSQGRRSPETEKLFEEYQAARRRAKRRETSLRKKIESRAKINRALGLGQMPRIAADILRNFDQAGLLGTQLIVVGTHALYGYGAKSGVIFQGDIMDTRDIDLMFDARRRISLALAPNLKASGLIGLLKSVDPSFTHKRGEFRAINDDGYYVDLIRPMEANEAHKNIKGIADNDLVPVAILGLQWLMNAPRFESTVIADDGLPLHMSSIDPRVFALYKYWLATKAENREPLKKKRDKEQAKVVAQVAKEYLQLPFKAKDLSALPIDLVKAAKAIA